MKRMLLMVAVCMAVSSPSRADLIGIYADQDATSCTMVAPGGFVPYSIYIIHRYTVGATGSQFAVWDRSTQAATGFSALSGFLVIGDLNDLSLAYGACLAPPDGDIPIVALNYFATGNTTPCGSVQIIPAPSGGGIVKYTNCDFAEVRADQGTFWFNYSDCFHPGQTECGRGIPVEETTWGGVKALFR